MKKKIKGKLYDFPRYYDAAFNFRNIKSEVDTIVACIQSYSHIDVKRVLEIACGPCPYMMELTKRGYEYLGIDSNQNMINHARLKIKANGIHATIIKGDLKNFQINEQVDFAFLPLGSIYASNMEDVFSHFQCISRVLRSGGLYLLDWVVQFDGFSENFESWKSTHEDLQLEGIYNRTIFDSKKYIYNEKLTFKVTDDKKIYYLENEAYRQALEPKDLNIVLDQVECFNFLGCWNNWNLNDSIPWPQGFQGKIVRPIILLQRT